MQAITTKYLGPTNFRGSRVKASCQAKTLIFGWQDNLNSSANHLAAAKALAAQLGWNYGRWIEAGLPDGSSVWVCDSKTSDSFEL
jgi:hypothetical protein